MISVGNWTTHNSLSECKAQQPYGGRMQPLIPNKLDFRVVRPIGGARGAA